MTTILKVKRQDQAQIPWLLSIVIFITAILAPSIGLYSDKAYASGEVTNAVAVQSYSSGTAFAGYQSFYDKNSSGSPIVNIPTVSGKVIKQVLVTPPGGVQTDITPVGVKGASSYNGALKSINGASVNVTSTDNGQYAQGYYAWYRYTPSDPDHTNNWYEDGGSQSECGTTQDFDNVNGVQMPRYPGCSDSSLFFTASREKPYIIDGTSTELPSSLVDPNSLAYIGLGDYSTQVQGPQGLVGYTDSSTDGQVITKIDADTFKVTYTQTFDHLSAKRDLGLPGAALMVYFAAFKVTISGKSYKYPDQVSVVYQDAPSGVDLTGSITAADACFTTGTNETFTYTISNRGTQDMVLPVTGEILVDGTQLTSFSINGGVGAGLSVSGTFTYTFGGLASKTFTLAIDPAPGEVDTTNNSPFISFTAQSSCGGGGGGPEVVTAKFTIEKPSIPFGDTNTISDNGSTVTGGSGCSIQEVAYTISQNGNTDVRKSTSAFSFNVGGFSPQPAWLTIGPVTITLKVTSTCGGQATDGPKTFQVTKPTQCTASNAAPEFKAGFVYHGASSTPKAINNAFPGDWLDVQIIQDALTDPATPRDPDGDPYYYYWDWKGAAAKDTWLKKYVDNYDPWAYDERYSFPLSMKLTSAEDGTHSIDVYATDLCGNQRKVTASINVMEPNPIPVITLPPKVVEGRPFTPDISGASSWSPMNRSIAGYEWYNTKQAVYPSAGNYTIKLDVTDSAGLKSLSPAVTTLNVLPDIPPKADASLPSKGQRGVPMHMHDSSFSPDGDVIVQHNDTIICDTNMNGSFTDDPAIAVSIDSSGNLSYTPTQLANCILRVYVKEDWGKSDTKEFPFTVINQQPTNQISVKGDMPSPPVVDGVNYNMSDLVTDTSRFNVEDAYNSSRTAGVYYDTTEQALAAPNRTSELYSVPTNASFSIASTGYDVNRYIWGDYGNVYTPMGSRGSKDNWYTFGTSGSFMCSSACWTPYGYYFNVFDARTNTARTMSDTNYNWIWDYHVNPVADILWLRRYDNPRQCPSGNYYQCPQTGTVTDYLFKLSNVAAGNFTPYQTTSGPWTSWHQAAQYSFWFIPDNAPPSGWVAPSSIPDKPAGSAPYNFIDNGTPTTKPYAIYQNPTDKKGNFYDLDCTGHMAFYTWDDNGREVDKMSYQCHLQKRAPDGTLLWTAWNQTYVNQKSSYSSSVFNDYPYLKIVYISPDNSIMVTNDGIYNNTTGAYMGQIPQFDYSSYNGAAGYAVCYGDCSGAPYDLSSGYGGDSWVETFKSSYQNIIYYRYDRRWTQPYCDSNCDYVEPHHVLYNIKTGQTILDVAGLYYNTQSQSNERFMTYGTLTSDGKLVLPIPELTQVDMGGWTANYYYPKIRVYDIMTGNLLMKSDPITSYKSNSSPCYYGGGGGFNVVMTGDGEGYLRYDTDNSHDGSVDYVCYSMRKFTFSGTTTSDGKYSYGNIVDKTQNVADGSMYVSVKFTGTTFSDQNGAGITFREQDNKNYYQAELTTQGVALNKVVNGVPTQLDKQTNPIIPGIYSDLKVKANKNHITVYVNGVPLVDVYDSQFASGKVGIFANAPNLYMKRFHIEKYPNNSTTVDNVVLVDSTIQYNVNFTDPDNDPAIPQLGKWTYTNTAPQKFLDAGDGKSDTNATNSYVNREVNSPIASINKVGIFKISFTEPDDPAPVGKRYPDNTYAAFRSYADPDTKYVAVHRKPISYFTVTQNADFTLSWNEGGYDPDRWLSSTNYSTEKAEYATNHGVYQRLYGYTDPDGNVVSGKLTRPSKQGTYTLREAVADEYGAWSDWYETSVFVLTPPPDNPPSVSLTFPNGTQSNPAYVNSLTPVITWNQSDPDVGTTFAKARIVVKDEWGNVVIDRTVDQNTTSVTGSWQLDTALSVGLKYQVQVMVSDDGGKWSGWSNTGWLITNRPPIAYMSFPYGTQASPTPISTLTPTFQWNQSDPDPGDGITTYQLQEWDQAGTTNLYDSGQVSEGFSTASSYSMTPTGNLNIQPHQPVRVRVQVWDSHGVASGFSPDAWMVLNLTPVADFDWTPKPAYEGDIVSLINKSSDPDNDALSYLWTITNPSGVVATQTTLNGTMNTLNQPGTWTVTLKVSDTYGGTSSVTKPITVLSLTVTGAVQHTPQWEINRKAYNQLKTGTDNSPWVPSTFLAGEEFDLVGTTTNTGTSSTKAISVIVTVVETGDQTTLSAADSTFTSWIGSLWKNSYDTLTAGAYHFKFVATWNNGTVKQDVQSITVDSHSIHDYWDLVRAK